MRRAKHHQLLAGHEFHERRLVDGVVSRRLRAKLGITCYNCGVYTTHADRDFLVKQHYLADTLPQCPAFHADLFGGHFAKHQRSIRNKWSKPDGD